MFIVQMQGKLKSNLDEKAFTEFVTDTIQILEKTTGFVKLENYQSILDTQFDIISFQYFESHRAWLDWIESHDYQKILFPKLEKFYSYWEVSLLKPYSRPYIKKFEVTIP